MKMGIFINIEKKKGLNDVTPIIIRKLVCFKLKIKFGKYQFYHHYYLCVMNI